MPKPLIDRVPDPFRYGRTVGRLKLGATMPPGGPAYYWIGIRVRRRRPLRHRLDAAFWRLALRLSATARRREQTWRDYLAHHCTTDKET